MLSATHKIANTRYLHLKERGVDILAFNMQRLSILSASKVLRIDFRSVHILQ